MARDGSSGGVIRMAVITPEGVERKFFAGEDIPRWVAPPPPSSLSHRTEKDD